MAKKQSGTFFPGHGVYELPRCDSEMYKKSLNLSHVVSSCTVHVMFYPFTFVFVIVLHALSISTVYMYVCYV